MNVKSIERDGNQTKIIVEIDHDLMNSGAEKAYQKARKSITLPGFRKGKAPRKLIESIYGAHVFFEDGVEEIFPEIYKEAVVDQGVKAVGRPSLTDMSIGDDDAVTVTIETEVYPEVALGEYKGLEVARAEAVVTDEEVEAELDRMAQNVASVETMDRPAQEGDTAVIDFEGFDNGVPFDGGKGENYELKIGSHTFVPGFEEQVVGMSAGEEKDIHVTFPEDYKASLAGKAVVFKVKVHKVNVTNVPAKDDEFAKDVSEFDTLEALKEDIRAKSLESKNKEIQSAFENAAVEKAAENASADLPNGLIEDEVDRQLDRFAYQLQMNGMSIEDYAKMLGGDMTSIRKTFRPMAEKQAKVNVTLAKVIEVEGLTVTDEEIKAEIARLAEAYDMEVEKVEEMIPADEVKESLLTQKAVKCIADSAVAVAPKEADAKETTEAQE